MNIFIDCEFNGPGGSLLSMALVSADERSFYRELPLPLKEPLNGWVKDNVIPLLGRSETVDYPTFQAQLEEWLSQFETVHLIADWPDDVKYFCEVLITSPGERINTPPLTMEIRRDLDAISRVPHHALWDAISIREQYYYVTDQPLPSPYREV